jgi:hypothetical protein
MEMLLNYLARIKQVKVECKEQCTDAALKPVLYKPNDAKSSTSTREY